MRMQKFDESIEQMQKAMALKPTSDQKTQAHVQSNWDSLLSVLRKNGRPVPVAPGSAGGAAAGAAGDDAEEVRAEITAIYEKHNPSKLGDIEDLMAKYLGRERKFLRMVKEKYGLQVARQRKPTSPPLSR